jgi:uncharacterized phage protein (TIGR02218 family)
VKPWGAALLAHYAQTTTHLATAWRVTRTDGEVFGWVDHDRDLTIDGVTYVARTGLTASATQTTADLQPATLDVTAFMDVSSEAEIEAGVWDEARVTVFETRWDVLPSVVDATQVNLLLAGKLGQIERQSGVFTAQLHGLLEQLDTQIGRVYSAACPWRLGDSRCQVDLTPYTHTGTITGGGADSRYTFHDEAQGQAAGYFNEGVITLTSGANAGHSMDIRTWVPPWFELHRPLPYPITVGDTYQAVRGDDKTYGTCAVIFDNQARFGGFPYVPGIDAVMRNPLTRPLT